MSVLLSARELTKAYGPRPLFSELSLELRAGQRVGLIGPNGSGKSTLLRILSGREEFDAGERSLRRSVKLSYLAQDDVFAAGLSVLDVLLAALADEPLEEHERETRSVITLDKFGFRDLEQPAAALSGGWRKRLALARELVREPDFLLLDEPTNHLDLPGVVWLERLLRSASFGYLAATHDRAFLRAVADDVIEINRAYPGGYFRAPGTYDEFVQRREEFLEGQARQEQIVANQVRRETDWLSRKAAAQTRKATSRVEDAAARREELAELKYRNATATAGIDFTGTGRQTRKLLTATGLEGRIAGRGLFAGLDLLLSPGTKLGLLGPNGCGKSTLLRVLAGERTPDSGTIVRADGLRTVMFEQGRTALNPETTLFRALCPDGDTVIVQEKPIHIMAWSKRFLFRQEQLEMPLGSLSGGEQARVRIAQLMLQQADLLLLDEPTNDLDIPALEVLEESLAEFPGALVLVSHDRDLMGRLCDEFVGLDGLGNSALYGSVAQWLTAYERATAVETPTKPSPPRKTAPPPASKPKPRKISSREQKEWEGMEGAILAAETKLSECEAAVESAALKGHTVLATACEALDAARAEVERLYARWQELETLRGG